MCYSTITGSHLERQLLQLPLILHLLLVALDPTVVEGSSGALQALSEDEDLRTRAGGAGEGQELADQVMGESRQGRSGARAGRAGEGRERAEQVRGERGPSRGGTRTGRAGEGRELAGQVRAESRQSR